eukprot:920243-Amphidinium_carterae.1
MRQGMAADAALVSWSRDTERLKRTEYLDGDVLMFSPPLLLQPGGPARRAFLNTAYHKSLHSSWSDLVGMQLCVHGRRKDSDIFVEGEAFKVVLLWLLGVFTRYAQTRHSLNRAKWPPFRSCILIVNSFRFWCMVPNYATCVRALGTEAQKATEEPYAFKELGY